MRLRYNREGTRHTAFWRRVVRTASNFPYLDNLPLAPLHYSATAVMVETEAADTGRSFIQFSTRLRRFDSQMQRPLLLVPVLASAVLLAGACGGSDDSSNPGVITEPILPTAVTQAPATVSPESLLRGFVYPIAGACLPESDTLMPNAPRPYRNGVHEGIDLYESDSCTLVGRGTEVLAAKAGTVIRADSQFTELTASELSRLQASPNTPEALDRFRGRQVWIDHGNGIVTRYAHLGGIAPGIAAGKSVTAGQVIAYVGESGTPESVNAPNTDNHLHFEVRLGPNYAGQGSPPTEVRRIYQAIFNP